MQHPKLNFTSPYFLQSDVFHRNINRKQDEKFEHTIFESCVNNTEFPFKGQLISIGLVGILNSSKKMNKKIQAKVL